MLSLSESLQKLQWLAVVVADVQTGHVRSTGSSVHFAILGWSFRERNSSWDFLSRSMLRLWKFSAFARKDHGDTKLSPQRALQPPTAKHDLQNCQTHVVTTTVDKT